MPSNGDNMYDYEVCFTVSSGSRTGQITRIRPDQIFYGHWSDDIVFRVKADSEERAEEKAFAALTDPKGLYVKKYGPGFEVKTKYIWRVIYQ